MIFQNCLHDLKSSKFKTKSNGQNLDFSDLDGDQKINYFLSWFNQWSDLQKSDFVNVLAERMSSTANGSYHDPSDSMNSMSLGAGDKKPPSLFDCQVKLFREWFLGWSDDQKNYLVSLAIVRKCDVTVSPRYTSIRYP